MRGPEVGCDPELQGGPSFYNGLLVAVTSFGYTETCDSHGGVYRLDTADDLNWLYGTFSRSL